MGGRTLHGLQVNEFRGHATKVEHTSRSSFTTNGELVSGPPMPKKENLGPAPSTALAGRAPAREAATATAENALAICLLADVICKLRAPKRPCWPKAATTAKHTAKTTANLNMLHSKFFLCSMT